MTTTFWMPTIKPRAKVLSGAVVMYLWYSLKISNKRNTMTPVFLSLFLKCVGPLVLIRIMATRAFLYFTPTFATRSMSERRYYIYTWYFLQVKISHMPCRWSKIRLPTNNFIACIPCAQVKQQVIDYGTLLRIYVYVYMQEQV